MMKKAKLFIRYTLFSILFLVASFFILDKVNPIDTKMIQDISRTIAFENGTHSYVTTNKEHKWRLPVDIDIVDPQFIRLLLSYEDKRFYSHYGVDLLAMTRAVWQFISHGKVISGASTITMQLAKLLHPRPRTVTSKLIEIVRALQLELHYTKDEILAAYLTLAPYGGNIEGVIAASMRYFGKEPYALTASQMALLIALPQSPESNRPDRHHSVSINAKNKVLDYVYHQKLMGTYVYEQALKEDVLNQLHALPRHAPHLAQKLLVQNENHQNVIKTTLNEKLQKQMEHWALSKERVLDKGTTLAVLVVRNKDAAIQAYLGSHNMFSKNVSGYVDMIRAIRSPGSTLKPFIYAYGFEKNIIHPNTMMLDEETRFGDYMPHNFSHEYTGEVTLEYALRHSLNIPAVKILNELGADVFTHKISALTGKLQIPKEKASLPIALGGIGISIWQLTQLYVALANGGSAEVLHVIPSNHNPMKKKKLLDERSAMMTTSILRKTQAPDGFMNTHQHIAYKTGTSYGYRDAWTIGYTKEYTVAVWVGKPDNSIQLKQTGRTTAAPLAFEILSMVDALVPQDHWQWSSNYLGKLAPEGLQYFDREKQKNEAKLKFIYPQKNERYMSADCSDAVVEVMIENGKEPYYWYIDGEAQVNKGVSMNLPFKHGAHTINIIDSQGMMVTRNIWVNKPEC